MIRALYHVCPEFRAALDAFDAEPTDERWLAVVAAARRYWAAQEAR